MVDRDGELVARAERLRREAEVVLADLRLAELLAPVGRLERVGSAAFGLALTRDIDVDILCPSLDGGPLWDALRPLAERPTVYKVRWTDLRGRFNVLADVPIDMGIYVGVHYFAGEVRDDLRWKLDCWFFAEDAPRPDIAMRDRLLRATDEERLAILRLKDEAMRAGRYGPSEELQGIHLYEAVLDRGVRTYAELERLHPG